MVPHILTKLISKDVGRGITSFSCPGFPLKFSESLADLYGPKLEAEYTHFSQYGYFTQILECFSP